MAKGSADKGTPLPNWIQLMLPYCKDRNSSDHLSNILLSKRVAMVHGSVLPATSLM